MAQLKDTTVDGILAVNGVSVNEKMAVIDELNNKLNWISLANSGVSIGGSKSLSVPKDINEVLVCGGTGAQIVFYNVVQNLDPQNIVFRKSQSKEGFNFVVGCQILNKALYISVLSDSDLGVTNVFVR